AISRSIGCVTSFSDSSAASAATSVLICTWIPVMSGTASTGKCSADHKPAPSSPSAPRKTKASCPNENSSMRLIMTSLSARRTQQEQTHQCQHNAKQSRPGRRLFKKQNPRNRHQRRPTRQHYRHRRKRTAFLEQQEKRNRPNPHTDP